METIQLKFDGFKKFISVRAPESISLSVFMASPLDRFLKAVYQYNTQYQLTIDEIVNKICAFGGVDKSKFPPEDVDRFKLYIEDFIYVANELAKNYVKVGILFLVDKVLRM